MIAYISSDIMSKLFLVFCFVTSVTIGDSYRILGILPAHDRSNFIVYKRFFIELANRNNDVALVSHFPMVTVNRPATLREISLGENAAVPGLSFDSVVTSDLLRIPFETLVSTKTGNDDCKLLLNNPKVASMLSTRPDFDVIIAESYNSDCGLAIAYNLSAPYIAFAPQNLKPWQYGRLGINFNAAHTPLSSLPIGKEPWFFDRVKNYFLYYVTNLVYYVGSQVTDHVYLYKYLGDELPTLESIAMNASLTFVNTHSAVFGGLNRPDSVIDVGGIHLGEPRDIPLNIQEILDQSEHGAIYVNFGTTVKESTLPRDKLNDLITTFSKLPMTVLWRWAGDIPGLPDNVKLVRWVPQHEVLKSPSVRAFISHAGILATIEAVDAGKPMVAVPLFDDQYGNAAALRDSGVATIVRYDELTKDKLLDAINEVLDPTMQDRAKQVSHLWHDRPQTPLDSAIYWTEYVARHGGAPQLSSLAAKLPLHKAYQLDVLGFYAVIILGLYYLLKKMCCLSSCCGREEVEVSRDRRRDKRVKFE